MIVIKDMEIPSSCYDCPFAKNKKTNDYGSFCECGLLEDYEAINLLEHRKHPNCPLIEQKFCDDCVSRAEVLKIYDEWFATCNITDKKESPKAKINALSSITPIRPKGYWREVDTNMYACSKCSHVLTIDPLNNSIQEMNTCPFCSAKMDGAVEV